MSDSTEALGSDLESGSDRGSGPGVEAGPSCVEAAQYST